MQISSSLPDHGAIVEAVLSGFVRAAEVVLRTGLFPLSPIDSDVRYIEEPEGRETWLLPNQVLDAGGGDCEDLSIWLTAGLHVSGEDPGARCKLAMTGPYKVHCIVQRSDGRLLDPSMDLMLRERGGGLTGYEISGPPRVVVHDNRTAHENLAYRAAHPEIFDDRPLSRNGQLEAAAPNANPMETSVYGQLRANNFAPYARDLGSEDRIANRAARVQALTSRDPGAPTPAWTEMRNFGQSQGQSPAEQQFDMYGNPLYDPYGNPVYGPPTGQGQYGYGSPYDPYGDPYGGYGSPYLYGQSPYGSPYGQPGMSPDMMQWMMMQMMEQAGSSGYGGSDDLESLYEQVYAESVAELLQ